MLTGRTGDPFPLRMLEDLDNFDSFDLRDRLLFVLLFELFESKEAILLREVSIIEDEVRIADLLFDRSIILL